MKSAKKFPLYFTLVFSVIAALAYLGDIFASLERTWHDHAFGLAGLQLKTGDDRLLLVAIDEDTVKKHGFPLPRTALAKTLDKLKELGVKTVVFDILFFEPREGDAELAAASKRHGGVVQLFISELEPSGSSAGVMTRTQWPVAPLKGSAAMLGSPIINHHIAEDGHIRTFSLFNSLIDDPVRSRVRPQPTASLAAVALSLFTGTKLDELEKTYGGSEPVTHNVNYRRPVEWPYHEKADEKWFSMTPEQRAKSGIKTFWAPYRTVSVIDILAGTLTEDQKKKLKGSLALVGSTTTGYYDHYPTPFTAHAPGAEYHLNVIDNVLAQDFLHVGDLGVSTITVFVAAWLPFLFTILLPTAVSAAATALLLYGAHFVSMKLMLGGTLYYPVAPALTLLTGFVVLTVHKVLTEGAEKAAIKAKFGQFVAPEIVEELANDPDKAKLGAQKREMTVFFLDIAHFTTISEKMDAEALIGFLNKYLSALSTVILDRRGTIDKYIGDCIMAFWNAPLENKSHALDAVRSALECQKAIAELNKNLDKGLPEIPQVRIGINTGFMAVGFTGTEKKLAYTVLGDEVNLASRLEGANKFFGSKIIVSGRTWDDAKSSIDGRYLGMARVVGKEQPVPVYEPLAEKGKLDSVWAKGLPVWEKGVKAFYDKKYDDALATFTEFAKLVPGDAPGELYLNLSRDYSALPPDDWDQVFNLTAK